MYILGLTGGLASGKSTVATMFIDRGVPVIDADKIVHNLQKAKTQETKAIARRLGDEVLTPEGHIDRAVLGKMVADNPALIKFLEDILHPAVRVEEKRQIEQAEKNGAEIVVLDVPLLFESGAEKLCDGVAWCDCPEKVRKERAFERPHMTEEKWKTLVKRRMPEKEAKAMAQYLIPTDVNEEETRKYVKTLVGSLTIHPAKAWPDKWAHI